MALIFSYGTLQHEEVQLATFGRRLNGQRDELPQFQRASVKIEDPHVTARLGTTHHDNVTFNGDDASRVPGMAFEITDIELASVDEYEADFSYKRVDVTLASGKHAWAYVHSA